MHTTGVATKADVLSVRVKLNEGEMVQTKVDNGLSLSRMLLNQICGLPTDTIVMLKEEVADTDVEEVPTESLERVYSRRPEVASLQLATDIYKKGEDSFIRVFADDCFNGELFEQHAFFL